ncbi:MAG: alanine--tRNA ligase [Bacilli bacterium]|nr:alanine--tRNA ligase [Bacilli bacterium]
MKYMTSQEIRDTWLNFFKSKGHHIEKGASLVPNNDPTLLWINAGVAALKKYFDGREVPPSRRIVNLQKCIRTNDIENVGKTARHHTFFEMMGNFSIGDYFRNEAIEYGFELLTSDKYFGLDKDKLYITYYPDDKDSFNKWVSLGIDPTHLIASKDNFWEIGEGPCGPDTEIYYDRGEKYDPKHLGIKLLQEDIENDRYIEIWNIVLSQFNAKSGVARKDYKELPSKNIDTGAGLERFALILQGVETNFDTDLFKPIINEVAKLTKVKYQDNTMSYRVIADHIKACTFALTDGAMFSNEGRGYVLRRLLRRAVSHGHRLNINKPFMYNLVRVVVANYSSFYPELINKESYVTNLIKSEEEKFFLTLTNGEEVLKEMIKNHHIDGFKLYDTFGFPIELTIELANEANEKVDLEDFKKKMSEQKERARSARGEVQSMHAQAKDLLDCTVKSEFTYELKYIKAKVVAMFIDGVKTNEIIDHGEIIFDKTNFYAEMGGQVADIGSATNKESQISITNVIKAPHQQHLHFVKVAFGKIHIGDSFTLKINKNRRHLIMRNHSATHLLDATLSQVLGPNVEQKGSFVSDERLRFDFNYNSKLDGKTIKLIERKVNEQIALALEVETLVLPIEEAKKLGAKMVFTEKYGDTVRVVKMGNYSIEFCGGTHVSNTSDIGIFKIESEESIASGIRRITARTSIGAYMLIDARENVLGVTMQHLGARSIPEIPLAMNALLKDREMLKLALKNNLALLANNMANTLKTKFKNIKDHQVLIVKIDGGNRDLLVNVASALKSNNHNYLIILFGVSRTGGNHLYVTSDIKEANAGNIARSICQVLGGSGGGKPTEANGKVNAINEIKQVEELVTKLL